MESPLSKQYIVALVLIVLSIPLSMMGLIILALPLGLAGGYLLIKEMIGKLNK